MWYGGRGKWRHKIDYKTNMLFMLKKSNGNQIKYRKIHRVKRYGDAV